MRTINQINFTCACLGAVALWLSSLVVASPVQGSELWTACAKVDITPERPIFLQGQTCTRIHTKVDSPLLATLLAIETRENGEYKDGAIFISFDFCFLTEEFMTRFRQAIAEAIPEFECDKLIVSVTHSHTSYCLLNDEYLTDRTDVMSPAESIEFITSKVVPAAADCWRNKQQSQFSFALGDAVVARCRRAVYEGGRALMYGETNAHDFRSLEAMEDHDVGLIYFWDNNNRLLAIVINVACPAQTVESLATVNADYWHEVRLLIEERYGSDVVLLPVCGAAGDMSPHLLYNKAAESRMRSLRGSSEMRDIAMRIVRAVDENIKPAEKDRQASVILIHKCHKIDVPQAIIEKDVYDQAVASAEHFRAEMENADDRGASGSYVLYRWQKAIIDRYNAQQETEHPCFRVPIHVLRISGLVICTNPFELYCDYGIEIKARSLATQTLISQLTDLDNVGGYLPTSRSIASGSYGSTPASFKVGPDGGRLLVEETLRMIEEVFREREE
ncbi:MAG: hypothetical protein Q4G68_12635 [Planctomycetia bacterium]|nr:hypothetical protein [Planctomycetia bacterium]